MPAFEELDIFLDHFALDCVKPDGSIVKVLLDSLDVESLGSMVITAEHKMTGKTSVLSDLKEYDTVTVDGLAYKVRKSLKIDDGLLTEIYLSRTT
jgi:hypothetical protein